MNRVFLKEIEEKSSYSAIEKNKICILGLGRNVGTTFVATLLAYHYSNQKQSVAYLELESSYCEKPLLFDSVDMQQRFSKKTFYSFHERVHKGEKIRGVKNIEENINWGIITPEFRNRNEPLSIEEEMRLLSNISGNTVIATLDEVKFASDFDCIICVVDPLPSKLLASSDNMRILKKIELECDNVVWVVNKFNKGVNSKDIRSFLKTKNICYVEKVDEVEIYSDEYQCRFHYRNKHIKEITEKSIAKLAGIVSSITKKTH